MTLIASTRVPDGIIIAADSLSSLISGQQLEVRGRAKCPNCSNEHEIVQKVNVSSPGVTTTLPFSQKVQPLWGRFGIGTHGLGILGNKSVFAVIRNFEKIEKSNLANSTDPEDVARKLANFLQGELKKMPGFTGIPSDKYALGFQLVGYKNDQPITYSLDIGPAIDIKPATGFGTTVSGVIDIVSKLWELTGRGGQFAQPFPAWSLQDAADYCRFLIETTANYQRFASVLPTVGGDIDIGVVLPSGSFRWMQRKPLASILFEEEK